MLLRATWVAILTVLAGTARAAEPSAWLGVAIEKDAGPGARVTRVLKHGAAEAAGLRVGDVIVGVGSGSVKDPQQLILRLGP